MPVTRVMALLTSQEGVVGRTGMRRSWFLISSPLTYLLPPPLPSLLGPGLERNYSGPDSGKKMQKLPI